jgi:ribosome-associated translation inhibitor RaiA
MQIQINTDRNIEGHDAMAAQVSGVVESALSRFNQQITHVELHLSDENSNKKGGNDDIRCMIEARLEGIRPIAVTHQAATVEQSVDGAADKMVNLIETTLGRLQRKERRRATTPLQGEDLSEEL